MALIHLKKINLKPHKYIIEASVLKESWPLSLSQWAFVNNLKENEAAELKVFSKDRPSSPSTKEGKLADSKAAVLKSNKSKIQKSKTPASNAPSRPASSAFDVLKPHWVLKWVSDATMAVSASYFFHFFRSLKISFIFE